MSISNQIANQSTLNGSLLEKVILGNDLSGLSSVEKVQYVKDVCQTIGLNPVTKPIQLMKFQGKEVPYFTKDATEQLRKINKVSINHIDTKILDGGVYVVTATATTLDGRQDSSTGVISINGLKGDALGNAMMKAETKAKRRVTLSICGLGFIDESEVESIPHAKKMDIHAAKLEVINSLIPSIEIDNKKDQLIIDCNDILFSIEGCETENELKALFNEAKKIDFSSQPDLLKKIIDAKDNKKNDLKEIEKFRQELNEETGEVLS